MKFIVDIPDTKHGQAFLKRAKALSYVQKATRIAERQATALTEAEQDQHALTLDAKVRAGKLKTRSARALVKL